MFAVSNGGAFLLSAVGVVVSPGIVAAGLALGDLVCARTLATVKKLRKRIFRIRQRKARTSVLSNAR
jgi:hypothetical protein